MASFSYNIAVTGDCSNTNAGIISLFLTGGTEPYTVQWQSPLTQVDVVTTNASTVTNLSASTYAARVNDSTLPTNSEFYINIPVSSGVCTSITSVNNTTCNLPNGFVTVESTSIYSSTIFYLFDSNNNFLNSGSTNTDSFTFSNLSASTYSIEALDLGGCTGLSQSFIVNNSNEFDYGLYVVPNSSCGGLPIGKIIVTGQTGISPYQYLWSDGQTGSTITGLTMGNYSVQVTDSLGCNITKSAYLENVDPVGFALVTSTAPSCLQSNGVITVTLTGGTAPYYYSASTGNVEVSYSQSYTISGLTAGNYQFQVTDAAYCQSSVGTTLATPGGITSVSVNSQNSTCSSTNGQIQISVVGGSLPYTYTLISPNGNTLNVSNSQTTYVFDGLSSGTYTVAVADSTGCSNIQEITIVAQNKYTISTEVTSTSCNQNNGKIKIYTTTGSTLPLDYSIDGLYNIIDTNLSAVTFNNLTAGSHVVTVTDADGCVQSGTTFIPFSQKLDFSLYSTSCGSGNSGQITAFITSGEPPFNFNWSDNIPNEPQQIQVSGLTGGTYSLTVVDNNGCSLKRTATITCNQNYVSYQTYVMGEEIFRVSSPTKFGLLQMLNEGYFDLTSGNTNCDLINATFTVKVSVNPAGLTTSQTFFTGTTLVQVPTDNLYYDALRQLLLSVPGVGNVSIDALDNQITIETSRDNTSLQGQEIIIDLIIVYDIMCLS